MVVRLLSIIAKVVMQFFEICILASKEADPDDLGIPLLADMYSLASEKASSLRYCHLMVVFYEMYRLISLKIIKAFNAEMSIILSNTAIGHLLVFLLQLWQASILLTLFTPLKVNII